METERYMIINNYDNYEVSNYGNVKNRNTGRILTPNFDGYYYNVNLSKDGKQKTIRIHRLVAIAFLDNPLNYKCIDHIDLNKLNNRVDNLRWVSYSINGFNIDKKKRDNCTSRFKGVSLDKKLNKYRACICINRKTLYLGLYDNEIDAAVKYNEKLQELIIEVVRNNNINIDI